MKVFMRKDVVKVGLAGQIIMVDDGYGRNYLIPQGLAIEVTPQNELSFQQKKKLAEQKKEVIATATSLLGQKIKQMKLIIKCKMHDDGKLYGGVGAKEVAELLLHKGINLSKSQIKLNKTIKSKGTYTIPIQLTSRLTTELLVEVISE